MVGPVFSLRQSGQFYVSNRAQGNSNYAVNGTSVFYGAVNGFESDAAKRALAHLNSCAARTAGLSGHYAAAVSTGDGSVEFQVDRNGFGVFYVCTRGELSFSSTLHDLLASCEHEHEQDDQILSALLTLGFIPDPFTLLAGVYKTSSMSKLRFSSGVDLDFPNAIIESPLPRERSSLNRESEDDLVDSLYQSFISALKEQSAGHSEVAVMLGGFDSALVASGLASIGKTVKTFSYSYSEADYNQPNVDTVSKFLSLEHTWVQYGLQDFKSDVLAYSSLASVPTTWPNYIGSTAKVAREIAAQGYRIVFTGDGCDYLFFGYPLTFERSRLIDKLASLPPWTLNALDRVTSAKALVNNEQVLGRPLHVLRSLIDAANEDSQLRGFLSFQIISPAFIGNYLPDTVIKSKAIHDVRNRIFPHQTNLSTSDKSYLSKQLLAPYRVKIQSSFAATGLLFSSPYLHPLVEDIARGAPESAFRNPGKADIGKYLLAKMASKYNLLPDSVIYQPKVGAVDAPTANWYKQIDKSDLEAVLSHTGGLNVRQSLRLAKERLAEKIYRKLAARLTSGLISLDLALGLLLSSASIIGLAQGNKGGEENQPQNIVDWNL